MVEAPPNSLNQAVDRAAAMLAADPAAALAQAQAILNQAPTDPRAALILASARRRLGDAAGARVVLERLAQAFPRAAHTQYELGATLAALGETEPALAALRRAVALNPGLAEAWRALGDALFRAGDAKGADAAYARHARAAVDDPRLGPAADALLAGDVGLAEQRLRARLLAAPEDAAALAMMGEVYIRLGRHADAEVLLARALELRPALDGARFSYASALFHQQKAPEALAQVEQLLARDPADPAYRNLLAACLGLVGEEGRVNAIYESLLADFGGQPKIWLNYGHALRTIGRAHDAVAAYRRCIALEPGMGDAYWGLANLKVAPFTAEEESAMAAQLERADLGAEDRLHLRYALGKALEDRGESERSFEQYLAGAAIRRGLTPYDAEETTALAARSKALFTADFFAAHAGSGSASEAPIFIVGLPRSGSTLIEQILASHSQVEGTMELPDIGFIAKRIGRSERAATPPRYPDALAGADDGWLTALGDGYIDSTRIQRKLGRAFFIDKMPNNFQHIGLIQLILPRAKIIDARRHPMATCFSAFKQHFAQGQNSSYDLVDLGRYYADYVDLMAHFDAVLPGRIHRVIYEDMVEDTEAEVRRLLDYCGLPFEAGVLKFYDNSRAVRTVSSEQVRRPIFRDGLEHWRRYEPWLGPLKTALGPALGDWRGAPP